MDFCFDDDDFFQASAKPIIAVKNVYQAKTIEAKGLLNQSEDGLNIEECVNLKKSKADFHYYEKKFEQAFDLYEQALNLTFKSKSLDKKFSQREIEESLARCASCLQRFDLALKLCDQLESTSDTVINFTSALSLRVKILEDKSDCQTEFKSRIVAYLKLLILHPYFIKFWIRCADLIELTENPDMITVYTICMHYVRENSRHTISDVCTVNRKQVEDQRVWLKNACNKMGISLDSSLEDKIFRKLELVNKSTDDEKKELLRSCATLEDLNKFWFFEFYTFFPLKAN